MLNGGREHMNNEIFKKSFKCIWIYFACAVVCLVVTVFSICKMSDEEEKADSKVTNLDNNSITTLKSGNAVCATISEAPYGFAEREEASDKYYFVKGVNGTYVVKMTLEDEINLTEYVKENGKAVVRGSLSTIDDDVKKLAIEVFADEVKGFDEKEYDKYFGNYIIEYGEHGTTDLYIVYLMLACICGILFIPSFIGGVSEGIRSLNFRKVSDFDASQVDIELSDPQVIRLDKVKVYLTRHYLVSTEYSHVVIPYADIVWMYNYTYRYNFIKTIDCIKFTTLDGKTYTIANKVWKRNCKDVHEQIFARCRYSNPHIVLGYTDDAKKYNKQIMKQIKQLKKSGQDPKTVLRPKDIEQLSVG